ncbi:MAG: putative Flp pilus-assembly TadE/G-like, partial [Chloroflexota bacterium]|nr:putative Flp pilus-assembly TadE/G-like [Chloroflexota bacterium]
MRARSTNRGREAGQIIVIFALALVVIIGMVGLVIDGGGAFAQRRSEQSVADVSSLAGANAYMNTNTVAAASSAAIAAARAAATRNGYTHGVNGATVGVTVGLKSSGAVVRVAITAPHSNTFARVMGMDTWPVSVTAGAEAAVVDTGIAAAPWIMNIGAFNPDGTPKYTSANPIAFGESNGDYPTSATDIAWTDYNGDNNVNSAEVKRIITGANVVTATIDVDQYVGQHNQGEHTTLFGDVNAGLAGRDVPIPVVGPCPAGPPAPAHPDGCFKGWAMFHVVSASG